MSTISKMCIRGIRSFGIESGDEQKITFQSPLTLIVGANGCGKTTVIECLKYALTGEVPPGSGRGQSFVHDPKIYHSVECLGQVKLMIRDAKGNKITVTRSMKTYQKKSQSKFETMDSTVHFESVDGQTSNSISGRCVDVTNEMCGAMGVSKAIINNVILCHQEDSNWPLDEGKKLKEKFDAIFGTTEYNKAIERILKHRKKYADLLKDRDADLKVLGHVKTEAEGKQMELQTAEEKLQKQKENYDKFQELMEPIRARLAVILKIESDIGNLIGRQVQMTTKVDKCREHQQSLQKKIQKPWTGDVWSLEMEIRTFKENFEAKNQELKITELDLNTIKGQQKNAQNRFQECDNKRGTLIYQQQQEKDLFGERAVYVMDVCSKLSIGVNIDLENSQLDVQGLLDTIKSGIAQQDQMLNRMGKEHDQTDQLLQTEIDGLREGKAKIQSEIMSKRNLVDETKKEQKRINFELSQMEESAKSLKEIQEEITNKCKQLESMTKNNNIEQMRQELATKKTNSNNLQQSLDKLDEDINFLTSISSITKEMDFKIESLATKESEFKRVKNKNADNLKRVFASRTIESNYKQNVQNMYEKLLKEIADINKANQQQQSIVTECQTMRKSQRDQVAKYEKELAEAEEKVYDALTGSPYEEIAEKMKEKIAKLQLDFGAFKASEVLYKRYISQMKGTPCCPLCHNEMSTNNVVDLTQELEDEIRNLPDKLQTTETLLKIEQKKYEKLISIKPLIERIAKLHVEVPQMKSALKTTEDKLAAALNDVENFELQLLEPKMNLQVTNNMLGDMSLLDEAQRSITTMTREVEDLRKKLPEQRISMTMEEAKMSRSTVAVELRSERQSIDNLQHQIEASTDKINKTREHVNQLTDRKIQLQEKRQSFDQFNKRSVEIVAEIAKINNEIRELDAKLGPATARLDAEIENKRKIKEKNRSELNALFNKADAIKKTNRDIERCTTELRRLGELDLTNQLEHVKSEIFRIQAKITKLTEENDQKSLQIDQLKKEIANQALIERELVDNLELKKLQNEETKLVDDLNELLKEIGDLDPNKMTREKDELNRKQTDLFAKKSSIDGQMAELRNQIQTVQKELEKPRYKQSIKNYLKMFYEVTVIKKIVADLHNYRSVLEWALLKYHAEKMEQINRSIKVLWREIYKGNDIDYISIKTDESEKESKSDKKRSYNYRVVQCKNDCEIDMRGRCSAGQKVLASLIIRMALAETFSNNCAVFALDEPTTNLDRANISSLVEALGRIVEERSHNANFMFIIITHDEEFVTSLERVETYYKLGRTPQGKSVIERISKY